MNPSRPHPLPDRARRGPRARRERAFALPMVILVSLVVVVVITVMISRQETQGLAVARQVEAVRDWHFSRGVKEIVDQWLKAKAGGSIRDILAADGKAFDLVLDDGTTLSFYLSDAQGELLTDTSGLTADEVVDLRGAVEGLRESVSDAQLAALTRRIGPSEVSIWTAPVEVLTAVCRQIAGGSGGDGLLRELLELRESKTRVSYTDLNEIATNTGLSEAHRRSLTRMIAPEPSLFRFVLDVRPSQTGAPTGRYSGYLVARSPLIRNPTRAAGQAPRSAFLSWESVPLR